MKIKCSHCGKVRIEIPDYLCLNCGKPILSSFLYDIETIRDKIDEIIDYLEQMKEELNNEL